MKTENKEPLYKVLDKQRTQGEWAINEPFINDNKPFIGNGTTIVMYMCPNPSASLNNQPTMDANAEYTALAVNNLAELAEALEDIIAYHSDIESRPGHKLGGTIPFLKAKKALSKIS